MSLWTRYASEEKNPRLDLAHARALIAGAPVAMGAIDIGQRCAVNEAWRTLLGIPSGSPSGCLSGSPPTNLLSQLHPKDAPEFDRRMREVMNGACGHVVLQGRWIRSDGAEIPCQATVFSLAGSSGHPTESQPLAIISLQDMSDHLRLQQECHAAGTAWLMQAAAARVLASATAVEDLWPALLVAIGETGGWDAGLFWQSSPIDSGLRCIAAWHGPGTEGQAFLLSLRQRVLDPNTGLPWDVWASGEPRWLLDVRLADRLIHTARAESAGLCSELCVPVRMRGGWHPEGDPRFAGVLEFLSRDRRDDGDSILRALTSIVALVESAVERIEADRPLRTDAAEYRRIAECAGEAIITIDQESIMEFVNAAAERIFGYTREEMLGQSVTMLMPETMRELHLTGLKRFVLTGQPQVQWENLELPGRHKNGHDILLRMTVADVGSDRNRRFTGYLRDVTAQKKEEAILLHRALHDKLTDLPNRTLLQERLNRSVLVSRRHSLPLSLLSMDLDRFKNVNDTLGHHCGDLLLKQVAGRLQRTMRESDTVARLGGDEFAVLLPSTDEQGAILAASRIANALKAPISIESHTFDIGVSIGIAHFPQHGNDSGTLMRRAEIAMYAAKRAASGHAVYSADRDEIDSLRLLLIGELRRAIEENEMILCYQPKVNLASGQIENVEALLRWQHPQRGLIPPDNFIPLAEESGLMKPLTRWVLNEALRQHRAWRDEGLDLRIAVNFSARVLHDPELVALVADLLQTWRVEPSRLEIEITESAIMVDPERAKVTLTTLHATGTRTSIDDFGTGHSSLSYLRHLPFDEIKIDKSFVLDMATSRDDASIVRSVVALGHNFDLRVVAEGVENQRTLDMLRMMGCDLAQGFFLSRPVSADDLSHWIRERETTLANAS